MPDGQLHLLPFDALRQDDGRYVLDSHIVTYAPSASVLYLLRRRSYNHAPLNVLGVGDVPYSSLFTANMAGSSALAKGEEPSDLFDESVKSLPNLPGSREEVLTVADVMKGNNRVLLGSYATEGQFKALSLRDYQVIHLAVHGVANLAFPDRAALILGHSPDLNEDGLLQAREIRELSLRAELVTLSACDTGNGRLLGVEGISSLENAFLMAGAKTVVASLWTADDTYTLALMKRLYQRLAEGLDTGSVVQRAKANFLEQFGNQTPPIFWAGFTVIGDAATRIVD